MKLVDLLADDRVVVPLAAQTLHEAGRRLLDALVPTGFVAEPDKLRELVEKASPRDAVTVGGHAFLIHFRSDAVTRLAVVLGVAGSPIARRRETPTRTGARIVLLIVAPQKEAATYLQAVSAFARAMARPDVVEALLAAKTSQDLLRAEPLRAIGIPGQLMVRDFMMGRVLSVRPEDMLEYAARLMVAHDVPSLPVVSETGKVLGIVGHREVLRFLLPRYVKRVSTGEFAAPVRPGGRDTGPVAVRDAMDRNVLCISEDQTLADVANLMVNKDIDRFPVVREGTLVGFITRGDIVRRLFGP